MREKRREPEVPGDSPSGRMSRWPARITSKELEPVHSVKWHPPECLFYRTKSGCRFEEKCSYAHRQVDDGSSWRIVKMFACPLVVNGVDLVLSRF